jgi:TPR repeat protein
MPIGCFIAVCQFGSVLADEPVSAQVQAWIVKAKAGDSDAQWHVATAYELGQGAPRDDVEAMKWYRLAAEQGNAAAQNHVADGLYAAKNYTEAMKWYRRAAEQGNAEAQNNLADGLLAGKRYVESLPWYERASAQGNVMATSSLGYLYDLGLGVAQDRHKGFDLYRRAAELGWPQAMWNIANMYGAGQLGAVDIDAACVWTVRAQKFAAPSDQLLRQRISGVLPQLELGLPPDQFARCKREAEAWSPRGNSPDQGFKPPAAPDGSGQAAPVR